MAFADIRTASASGMSATLNIAQDAGNNRFACVLIGQSHWTESGYATSAMLNGVAGTVVALSGGPANGANYQALAAVWFDDDLPATAGDYTITGDGSTGNHRVTSGFSFSGAAQSVFDTAAPGSIHWSDQWSASFTGGDAELLVVGGVAANMPDATIWTHNADTVKFGPALGKYQAAYNIGADAILFDSDYSTAAILPVAVAILPAAGAPAAQVPPAFFGCNL